MSRTKIQLVELLDAFCWGMDKITKPTLGNLLGGYDSDDSRSAVARWLAELEEREWLKKTRRGNELVFTITPRGREQIARFAPRDAWDRGWDGKWRALVFDLPMVRQKDRQPLWRALRGERFGLLQRSVWVWPHDVEEVLPRILEARGIPECFCGLEVSRLFLCTHEEVVASAWDWEEIGRRQQAYRQHLQLRVKVVRQATDLAELTRLARLEGQAYADAFALDPLLPRPLWPAAYAGPAVLVQHDKFREQLGRRLRRLAP